MAETARTSAAQGRVIGVVDRARVLRVAVLVAACLSVFAVGLLIGALGRWVGLVAVAGLGVVVCEVALHRLLVRAFTSRIDRFDRLTTVVAELYARLPLELALLLVFVVRADQMSVTARSLVVVAVVVHQLLRFAHTTAGHVVTRLVASRPQVRDLPGVEAWPRPRTPLLGSPGLQVIVAATGLPALALSWAALSGSYALVAPAALGMALVAAAVAAPSLLRALALVRRAGDGAVAAVHEAIRRHRPEVVFYSGGDVAKLNWVTQWLDTLDEVGARGRRVLVLLSDPEVLEALPPARTPIVHVPEPRDLRRLPLSDARVALFPNDDRDNFTLLRRFGLRTALVGHGDSDKPAYARPTMKVFDEVWVAGEAGRDRFFRSDVGVRPHQIRIVGRPQVRHLRRGVPPGPGAVWSVLYAPTWESSDEDVAGSSLLHSGLEVVRRLLALDAVRVLYRPHPHTGIRDARYLRADAEVRALLAGAGTPHEVVDASSTDIWTALNTADLLVADVSSVTSDFTATGKPQIVVNGTDLSAQAFHERFPSTAGAAIVGRGGEGLDAAVADARGPDELRSARDRVRRQLIGPPTDDPIALFVQAIDELGNTLPPR